MATSKSLAVVLSDVHIGDNSPTCWYQSKVHDPFLTRILEYVVANKEKIHELILLGDMFDVWTYPPSVKPPGMPEILKANPKMLGPSGPLAAACKALPGQVRIILGNHDGTLIRADIDALNANMKLTSAESIQFVEKGIRFCEGAGGGKTVFSHGHYWCMFNAPDPDVPKWSTLPVGHFVTRAIGYDTAKRVKKLGPGKTVADLPNMGNPMGIDLKALLNWKVTLDPDLVETLLDYVCDATKMKPSEPITMPDGSKSSVDDAKKIYRSLFARWYKRTGGRKWDVARAAMADNWGEHLAWFAQRLAMQTGADLVVFGHTHHAVGGLVTSPVSYYNSGYECVSTPDSKTTPFTFTVVDKSHASAEVFEAYKTKSGTYDVRVFPAKPIEVIVGKTAMDFSCYVRIENQGSTPLKLVKTRLTDGYWVVPPPAVIGPGKRADMWLQDEFGTKGATGGFIYNDGFGDMDFSFSCPTGLHSNTVSSPVSNWMSKVGTNPWDTGSVRAMGHPLQVRFTVPMTTVTRAKPKKPAAAVA